MRVDPPAATDQLHHPNGIQADVFAVEKGHMLTRGEYSAQESLNEATECPACTGTNKVSTKRSPGKVFPRDSDDESSG